MKERRRIAAILSLLIAAAVGSSCSSENGVQASSTQASSAPLPKWVARKPSMRIVFAEPLAGEFGAIASIRADGKGLRRLVAHAYDPAVSPGRMEIAYEGQDYGLDFSGGIFTMRADGLHVRLIARETGGADGATYGQPAWSPDGRMLVYVASSPCPGCGANLFASSLFTMSKNGSGRKRIAETQTDAPGPSWIDATHILYTSMLGEFFVINARTGEVVQHIPAPRAGTQPAAQPPALSPNRRELAYTECLNPDCSSTSVDLITPRGILIRRIRGASSPAFSPRGDLLYSCCGAAAIAGNHNQIMLVPSTGGEARAITPPTISADQPAWLG